MILYCAGMRRSGSTAQYLIAKELVERYHRGLGVRQGLETRFDLWERSAWWYVVKGHRVPQAPHPMIRDWERVWVLRTFRDVRDCVVSNLRCDSKLTFELLVAMRRYQHEIECQAEWDRMAPRGRTLLSRYEHSIAPPYLVREVARIAQFLGIAVAEMECQEIAAKWGVAANRKRPESPETYLIPRHCGTGSVGQWRTALSAEQVEVLNDVFGRWLAKMGYAVD